MAHFLKPPRYEYANRISSEILPIDAQKLDVALWHGGIKCAIQFDHDEIADQKIDPPDLSPPSSAYTLVRITPKRTGTAQLDAKGPDGNVLAFLRVDVVPPTVAPEDMVYNGRHLNWFRSLPAGASLLTFDATSGHALLGAPSGIIFDDHQTSRDQGLADQGPIPEGLYSFLAERDPKIYATKDAAEEVLVDTREGIQQIPLGGKRDLGPIWGTFRVRLTPIGATKARQRGGFYLHDSRKGYTHGCVETQTAFFEELLRYADQPGKRKKRLVLKVTYADRDTSTRGHTNYTKTHTEYRKAH